MSNHPVHRPDGDWYPPVRHPGADGRRHPRRRPARDRRGPARRQGLRRRSGRSAALAAGYAPRRAKTFASEVVAADLNKDGTPELVFGTYALKRNAGRLVVLSAHGKVLSVTRLRHQGQDGNGIGVAAAPSIGDLTGNGTLEIVLTTFDHGVDVYTVPGSGTGCLPWPTGRGNPAQRHGRRHGALSHPRWPTRWSTTSRASSSMPWMNVDLRRRSTGRPRAYRPGLSTSRRRGAGGPSRRGPARRASGSRVGSRSPRRSCGSRRCAGRAAAAASAGAAVGGEPLGRSASRAPASPAHWSKRVEQPVHLEVREREDVAQAAGEQGEPSRIDAQRPTSSTPSAASALRSSVARSGVPTSWGDGSRRARVEVVDLVVALVPHAGGVHPPQDVAPAIGARQPHVLADRQGDRTARLAAARRRAARPSPTLRRRARRRRRAGRDCGSRTS